MWLLFWRPKDSGKRTGYVFTAYKQTKKVRLVYLECRYNKVGIIDEFSS